MRAASPVEQAEAIVRQAQDLTLILRASAEGTLLFSREDVEKIVEGRLSRERKKRRAVEAELATVEAERDELEAWLDRLQGEGSSG